MTFEVQHTDPASDARAGLIQTAHGPIQTPIFMPVGTAGSVKGVTFHYVENVQDVWDFALTNEIVNHPLDFTIPEEDDEKAKK